MTTCRELERNVKIQDHQRRIELSRSEEDQGSFGEIIIITTMFTGNNIILFIFVVLSILIGVIANWITAGTTIMSGGFPASKSQRRIPLAGEVKKTDHLRWIGHA